MKRQPTPTAAQHLPRSCVTLGLPSYRVPGFSFFALLMATRLSSGRWRKAETRLRSYFFFVCVIFYRAALGLTEFRGNSCHCNLPSALGATTKPGKKKTRYAPLTRFCLAGAAECVPLRLDAIF